MDSGANKKEGFNQKQNRGGRGQKRYRRGGFRGNRGNYNQNYYNQNMNYSNRYPSQMQPQQFYNPFMQQQMLYRTEMYICSRYRNLIDINTKNASLYEKIDSNSKFFVIKSFSEEDVHKSIKYGVWSSSKNGNLTLSNAFQITKEKNGSVYLFFSCNGSGRYAGIARMKTACDENRTFEFWTQDGKWTGLFDVEWIFIKDVPFKEFKDIIITMKDGEIKPISNARDTQEIPFEQAKIMIEKISKYQNSNTILEHFEFYDIRQENYEKNMQMKKNNYSQQSNPQAQTNNENKETDKSNPNNTNNNQ
jgi:hypothetical protein